MNAYELDYGLWTGKVKQLADGEGWPAGWAAALSEPAAIGMLYTAHGWQTPTSEMLEEIAEAKRKAAVPESITPRQLRQGLTQAGLRDVVEAYVAAAPQDVKDWWETSSDFQRTHPLILAAAEALKIPERALDDLWTLSGSL